MNVSLAPTNRYSMSLISFESGSSANDSMLTSSSPTLISRTITVLDMAPSDGHIGCLEVCLSQSGLTSYLALVLLSVSTNEMHLVSRFLD